MTLMNVLVTNWEEATLTSKPDGTPRSYYSQRKYNALGLNCTLVDVEFRITGIDSNAEASVALEGSFDNLNFTQIGTVLIDSETGVGTYRGTNADLTELMPYMRLQVSVAMSGTPTTMKWVTCGMRTFYRMKG